MRLEQFKTLAATFAEIARESQPRTSRGVHDVTTAENIAEEIAGETDAHEAFVKTPSVVHYATLARLDANSITQTDSREEPYRDERLRVYQDAALRVGAELVTEFVEHIANRAALERFRVGDVAPAYSILSEAEDAVAKINEAVASRAGERATEGA